MAWRGVVPMERLPQRLRQQYGMTWIGPHGHVVTYPLRRGELLNFVTAIERDDWLIESWSEAGTVAECRRDFARVACGRAGNRRCDRHPVQMGDARARTA